MSNYNLSQEQENFIKEAEGHELRVDYEYSSPFLKGRKCPAVKLKSLKDKSFNTKSLQWEKGPDGFIVYAPY